MLACVYRLQAAKSIISFDFKVQIEENKERLHFDKIKFNVYELC